MQISYKKLWDTQMDCKVHIVTSKGHYDFGP